jgi:hypothetical protein
MKDYMQQWNFREAFLISMMGETDLFYRILNSMEW